AGRGRGGWRRQCLRRCPHVRTAAGHVKVVLAGGAGSLGRRIAADLAARSDEVVVLSRSPSSGGPGRQVRWDGVSAGPWAAELAGAAVINLAGELVDRRPTAANIELLTESRVRPTPALRRAPAGGARRPPGGGHDG